MKIGTLKKGFGELKREAITKNFVIACLVISNCVAVVGWFQTKETTVLIPPLMDERMELSASDASRGYKEAWALSVALLAGNITPGNADFVRKKLGDIFSPSAFRSISQSLADQINDIKRDSLTVSFDPSQVSYEPETRKVFVTGQFASKGVSGRAIEAIRTYEMVIDIRFSRPWVTAFKPYQGMPVTIDVAKQQQAQRTAQVSQ